MVAIAMALAEPASADEPPIRAHLEYVVGDGAECPTGETLRAAIAARLGRDPFSSTADGPEELTIRVVIRPVPSGLMATISLSDGSERTIESPTRDCRELAETLVLPIVLAIDPFAPEARAEPRTLLVPVPVETPPDPAKTPIALELSIGALAGLGVGPELRPGLALGGALGIGSLRIELGGEVHWPADAELPSGGRGVTVLAFGVAAAGCYAPRPAFVCGVVRVGAHRATPFGLADPAPSTTPDASVGARLGVALALTERVSMAVGIDGLLRVTRATLTVSDEPVFSTSDVLGALRAEVRFAIP